MGGSWDPVLDRTLPATSSGRAHAIGLRAERAQAIKRDVCTQALAGCLVGSRLAEVPQLVVGGLPLADATGSLWLRNSPPGSLSFHLTAVHYPSYGCARRAGRRGLPALRASEEPLSPRVPCAALEERGKRRTAG